jgi:hypothetical protein
VDASTLFFQIVSLPPNDLPIVFLGSAFKISSEGGLVTCRHVVDTDLRPGDTLAVRDYYGRIIAKDIKPQYWNSTTIDLAYLHAPETSKVQTYLHILDPSKVSIGDNVYTFGYYAIGKKIDDLTPAYLKGNVVNIHRKYQKDSWQCMLLSYAIIEGMSGSPVLIYHNGVKVVGVCIGSDSQRVIARELVEYKEPNKEYKESINRIVEFGVAYHPITLISFLQQIPGAKYTVGSERLRIPGLE